MKTFGELNIGDELYCLNDISVPWGTITKHKIINITRGPIFIDLEIANYNGETLLLHERLTGTTDYLAPTLAGVKTYWEREYKDMIERQEKEIESLKAGLVVMYDSLNKILKAEE